MMWRYERAIAWRHFVTGGSQTLLTISAVAVSVVLIIFITSLINGLQQGLIEDILGGSPLVTVSAPDREVEPLWSVGASTGVPVVARLDSAFQRRTSIEQWEPLGATIASLPQVTGVSPRVSGGGFVSRGSQVLTATIAGIEPDQEVGVTNLARRMVQGEFSRLDREGMLVGVDLAKRLRVGLGERLRLTSNQGESSTFFIRGLFDLGLPEANERLVFIRLRPAQGMLRLGSDVSAINVRTEDVFQAEAVANEIRKYTRLDVASWMVENRSFLDGLEGQSRSSTTIVAISLLASLFAVAGIMIVFVSQKARDIGILKAMGSTRRQITRIFLLEGVGFGLAGGIVGGGIGTGLALLVQNTTRPGATFGGKPAAVVPMQWEPGILLGAMAAALAVGIVAAVLPARRAAALDPVEVIRGV